MPEPKYYQVEIDGPIIIWKFHNPPKNLMNGETVTELKEQIEAFDQNPELRVGIVTSATPGLFIQHFDVSILKDWGQALSQLSKEDLNQHLAQLPPPQGFFGPILKPLICAINGPVEGGGCEMALECDFRFISRDSFMAQPEIMAGFPPGGGGTQRTARLLGAAKALEICLTGGRIYGDEAEKIGLVTKACNPDDLMPVVLAFARNLAAKPLVGLINTKKAIYEGLDLPLQEGLIRERSLFLESLMDPVTLEIMKLYVEAGQDREALETHLEKQKTEISET
jgi:enoyl-CoA hydratase